MTDPGEEFTEQNDIESARLALRGALATIRDLQDLNLRLKGNLQEAASREKLAQQEIAQIQVHLRELESRDLERQASGAALKDEVRREVLEEQKGRIEEDRRVVEQEAAQLRSLLAGLRQQGEQKEREWLDLKRLIELRDADLLKMQREKAELVNRYQEETALFGSLRGKREEGFQAALREHEAELERKDQALREAQRKNRELAEALTARTREQETRLQEREEELLREDRLRQAELQQTYAKRRAEVEAHWATLEEGLWRKAKETQEKLDLAAQRQLEERARDLEERSLQVEAIVDARRAELETEWRSRAQEHEEKNQKREDALSRREQVLGERERVVESALEVRRKELEALSQKQAGELEALLREEQRKALEREKAKLESEFAHRDHDVRTSLAAREQSLLEQSRRLEMQLQEERLKKANELQEEWNRRKIQLLEEQDRAVEAEKAILKAQLEQEGRKLDEAYRARVAELERMQATLEEQFRTWKATVLDEYVQKEKNLDKQWHIHEQELVRKYEIALEQERRSAQFETARTREQYEQIRKRLEDEFFQRSEAQNEKQDAALREREAQRAKQEADAHAKHQAELQELRDRQRTSLAQQAKHFEAEMARVEEGRKSAAALLREKQEGERIEWERQLLEAQATVKDLKEKVSKAEAEDSLRRAGLEKEKAALEAQHLERVRDLESRTRMRDEALKRERERLSQELKQKEEILRQGIQREFSETMEGELRAREGEWLAREQAAAETARMKEERLKVQFEKREEFLRTEQAHKEADLIADYELRIEKEKRRLAEIEKAMAERLKERGLELEKESRVLLSQKEALLLQKNQEVIARERAKLEAEFADKLKAAERKKRE